jgi:Kef-type K+ transport system membrane component KefB
LPKLVAYLASGAVFGPWVLNIVPTESVAALAPVSTLAIGLIAFLAGAELRIDIIRRNASTIARILSSELLVSLAALTLALTLVSRWVPFLAGGSPTEVFAFSLVFASIGVVHSPAVAMGLLNETGARGPLARTSLSIVLVSDVVIVLLLTAALSIARALVPPHGLNIPSLTALGVVWEIAGAALIGSCLGALISLYLRVVRRELFLFAIIIAVFGKEIARLAGVEPLLTLITAGFVTENASGSEHAAALRTGMERAAAPVFVVFFALAGAQIVLPDLARLWPLVVPLFVLRAIAIWAGCRIGARWANLQGPEHASVRRHLWTALLPQAGVAIGLAAAVAETYPARGAEIRTLFLALVAVNQAVGPILFRVALQRSGEIPATNELTAHGLTPTTP